MPLMSSYMMEDKETLEKRKIILDAILAILTFCSILVGGVLGFAQYFENKQEAKVKQTLLFIDRKERNNSFKVINSLLWRHSDEGKKNIEEFRNILLKEIEDKRLEEDIDGVVEFYFTLLICIRNAVCDSKTAYEFFHTYAVSFYYSFKEFLEQNPLNSEGIIALTMDDYESHINAKSKQLCR